MRANGSVRPLYVFFAGSFGFFTGGLGFGVITVMLRGPFVLALPVGVAVGLLAAWLLYRRVAREMGWDVSVDRPAPGPSEDRA